MTAKEAYDLMVASRESAEFKERLANEIRTIERLIEAAAMDGKAEIDLTLPDNVAHLIGDLHIYFEAQAFYVGAVDSTANLFIGWASPKNTPDF